MAGNHGFADGNKRTTLILLHALVSNSGYRINALDNEEPGLAVETVILAAASSTISIEQLTEWFRLRITRV